MLVFTTVFGLSVEDLSEAGGLFLGVDDLTYGVPVYPGDTLTARSTVRDMRESASRPNPASSPGTRAATTSAANWSSNFTAPTW